MKFSHPLARSAKVWSAELQDGATAAVLTVVTTLELDRDHKKYKPEHVDRLRAAIREYLTANPDKATGFVLMNKPKD